MFHLFAGEEYYPEGGMRDYRGAFTTIEAAKEAFDALRKDWGQIVEQTGDGRLILILKIRRHSDFGATWNEYE